MPFFYNIKYKIKDNLYSKLVFTIVYIIIQCKKRDDGGTGTVMFMIYGPEIEEEYNLVKAERRINHLEIKKFEYFTNDTVKSNLIDIINFDETDVVGADIENIRLTADATERLNNELEKYSDGFIHITCQSNIDNIMNIGLTESGVEKVGDLDDRERTEKNKRRGPRIKVVFGHNRKKSSSPRSSPKSKKKRSSPKSGGRTRRK
jgi:hypothetical protein